MMKKILACIISIYKFLVRKGFFSLLTANFLTQFLGFGTILLVAKILSPIEIGQIRVFQSYIAVFMILAGFGFNTAVLRYCAENISVSNRYGILKYAVKCSIYSIIASYLLLYALAYGGFIAAADMSYWFIVYGLALPFMALTNLGMVYLQAIKQINKMAKTQSIIKLQSFILILVSTYIWGFKGFIVATICAYAVGLIPLIKEIGYKFILEKTYKPERFMYIAVFSMLANGVSLLGQYGDIFILDKFCNDRVQIGFYSLATIFLTGAMQVTGTVQSIVTPYFSEHSNDKRWVYSQLIKNQIRMMLLGVLVAVGIYFFCYYFVPWFYGYDYTITLLYLRILLLKYVIYSSYAITGVCLVGLGLMKYNFGVVFISTPVSLFLSYLLLQSFGVIGVTYAQLFTAMFVFILQITMTKIALSNYYKFDRKISVNIKGREKL